MHFIPLHHRHDRKFFNLSKIDLQKRKFWKEFNPTHSVCSKFVWAKRKFSSTPNSWVSAFCILSVNYRREFDHWPSALNDGRIGELTVGTIFCMSLLHSLEARTEFDIEDACSKHQLGSIEGRWRIMRSLTTTERLPLQGAIVRFLQKVTAAENPFWQYYPRLSHVVVLRAPAAVKFWLAARSYGKVWTKNLFGETINICCPPKILSLSCASMNYCIA